MKVYTKIVWDMRTMLKVHEESLSYFGPVELCKGASAQMNTLAAQQSAFYSTLQSSFSTQFANQSNILAGLTKAFQPIVEAGPNQFGFSGAETAALRSQATEGTAGEYNKAASAVGEQMAARGGSGDIASGADERIKAQIATTAAESQAAKQLGITQVGYEQGRSNFMNAANVLGGVASQYNPLGYAGAATTAGNSAFDSASKINEINNQNSIWGTVGGILGGVAGSFAGPMGASIGSKIGSGIGNAAGGQSPTNSGGWFGGDDMSICWIAEALYGTYDPRTSLIREWLTTEYNKNIVGKIVVGLYKLVGKEVAKLVNKFSTIRRLITPLFEKALEKATEWKYNG